MIASAVYNNYLENLLSGQRTKCFEIAETLIKGGIELNEFYSDLIRRSMYQVGELWETNKISVAVEHLCTAITESVLSTTYPVLFAEAPKYGKVIISCSPNEYHQLGGRIIADYLTFKGWDCMFLGANTPVEDMISLIKDEEPDFVGLSLSIFSKVQTLVDTMAEIKDKFPETDIIVGGHAFMEIADQGFSGDVLCRYISGFEELDRFTEEKRAV